MFGRETVYDGVPVQEQDVAPICPHCLQDLDAMWFRKLDYARSEVGRVYFCPSCRRVLGVNRR